MAGCFTRSRLGFYGFFFFVIGGVIGFVLCFLWMGLGKFFFFFFGYRCNMIFYFFLMFFMGGSWQASSWLGWACFC